MKEIIYNINVYVFGKDLEWRLLKKEDFDKLITAQVTSGVKVNTITNYKEPKE